MIIFAFTIIIPNPLINYIESSSDTITIDSDLDGISDKFEENGIDVNNDGLIDLDLKKLGANPSYKDIFLELDYMLGFETNEEILGHVVNAFSNAPVTNPNGQNGINLHIIIDEQIPLDEMIKLTEIKNIKQDNFGTSVERSDPNFNNIKKAKDRIFHYSLFIDKIEDKPQATGFGFNPKRLDSEDPRGMNFVISLGILKDIGRDITPIIQQGTLMHELGHNMGLKHGGKNENMFKPNYISVMNYLFQTGHIERDLDYSGCSSNLQEGSLDESKGIFDPCKDSRMSGYFLKKYCDTVPDQEHLDVSRVKFVVTNAPINWNNNNNLNEHNIIYDVNCDKILSNLDSTNDWNGLFFIKVNDETLSTEGQTIEMLEDESFGTLEEVNRTSLLDEELSIGQYLGFEQGIINNFYDTLNSLPETAFQSNNLTTSDGDFSLLESDLNESEKVKHYIVETLGVSSNENETGNTFESLDDSNNVQGVEAYIEGFEKISQGTDSSGSDDFIKGVENQKKLYDSLQNGIEKLKQHSCKYSEIPCP